MAHVNLLPRYLLLNGLAQPVVVRVAIAIRVELVRRELLDELIGELGFHRREDRCGACVEFVEGTHFVGIIDVMQHQPDLVRPQQDELLFAAGPKAADRDPLRAIHGVAQELVRLSPPLSGPR